MITHSRHIKLTASSKPVVMMLTWSQLSQGSTVPLHQCPPLTAPRIVSCPASCAASKGAATPLLLTCAFLLTPSQALPRRVWCQTASCKGPMGTAHLRLGACLSHDLEPLQVQAQHRGKLAHCQLLLGRSNSLAAAAQCFWKGLAGCTRGGTQACLTFKTWTLNMLRGAAGDVYSLGSHTAQDQGQTRCLGLVPKVSDRAQGPDD